MSYSSVKLGTDKFKAASLSKLSYTAKSGKRCRSAFKRTHTNSHNFSLGFHPAGPPTPKALKPADKAVYVNLNDKTNWNFGPFKQDLKTISSSHFKGEVDKGDSSKTMKNLTWESNHFKGIEKTEYKTTSMDYKGGRASRRKVLKIPDSVFFPVSCKNHDSQQIIQKTGTGVQDPSISHHFIYSQHFSFGNHSNPQESKKVLQGFTKDTTSAWVNREKVLGSEIEFGLGKNQYLTMYKGNYVRRYGMPPDAVRNYQSFVKFGSSDLDSCSEYHSEFKKQPFCQAVMVSPKNEKQNIKIC
jgi:hypothetical protein